MYGAEEDFQRELEGVKSVRTEEITSSVGRNGEEHQSKYTTVVSFDDSGKEIERAGFRDEDEISFRVTSEYDDSNQLKTRKTYHEQNKIRVEESFRDGLLTEMIEYKPDETVRFKSVYAYDPQQRLVYNARFYLDGLLYNRIETKYDRLGGRIVEESLPESEAYGGLSENLFTANGTKISLDVEAVSFFKAEYAADNNPISAAYYKADNSLIKKYAFLYRADGLLAEAREYVNPANMEFIDVRIPGFVKNLMFTAQATYDYARQGDWNELIETLTDTLMFNKTLYLWDHKGQLTCKHKIFFGKYAGRTDFKYGSRGELLQETTYNEDDSVYMEQKFQWEFDERGNWIKRTDMRSTTYAERNINDETATVRKINSETTKIRIIEYLD